MEIVKVALNKTKEGVDGFFYRMGSVDLSLIKQKRVSAASSTVWET